MFRRILKERGRRSLLFGEMMRRFGLKPERDLTMRDVQALSRAMNRCRACGAVERCEGWMTEAEGTEGAEAFCPNAAVFRSLCEEDASSQ